MRNTNTFASTFYFFSIKKANAEKNKKSLQANAPDSRNNCANLTRQTNGPKEERTDNRVSAPLAHANREASHTTVRTGLVYGGSLSIGIIALFTNNTFALI